VRLEHANITVRNIDAVAKFLKTAFADFRVRGGGQSDAGGFHKRWQHFGNDMTYIALEEVSREPHCIRKPYEDPGTNHVGFEVDDIDALHDRLCAAGYKGGFVPQERFRRRMYFLDGVGNEWEFIQYLSDKPSERNDYTA